MILSDRSIKQELAAGRIIIEPLDPTSIQPSSVDLHVDRYFRVFRNDTTPFIDPKEAQEDLTELVEVDDGRAFILHPGEFVLGSTLERVALPGDLVARLEGKSSLGRLGLLIHSSLPASEGVPILDERGDLREVPIGDIVRERMRVSVVSFDPITFHVGYERVTGWFEGPPDRIYEVALASGRCIRVTAGHCLFGLDRNRDLVRIPTCGLRPGARVAVPKTIPDPPGATTASVPDPLGSHLESAERHSSGAAAGTATLRRLRGVYQETAPSGSGPDRLGRLVDGDLFWDTVVSVRDTGVFEPIFDLEVRPDGRHVENFVAGNGAVFASNTAGFVDAGWDGHLTLELSNVANLPIAIYPGMKIGQLSFLRMTTEADHAYGSDAAGSKYQGQRGPTPSRYYLNFRDR